VDGVSGEGVLGLAGALLVVFFLESTRFLTAGLPGLGAVQVAATREFLIGLGLILVLRLRPSGLVPERIPRVELPSAAPQSAR
jgi:branched-chain amino acid transport system permease protein